MLQLFYICFGTGVVFTILSFFLNQFFDFLGLDGDIDIDADWFGFGISPFKPVVITAFVTVFGGAGIIAMRNGMGTWMATLIAILAGLLIGFLMYRFVIVPLHKAQTNTIAQEELVGQIGTVTLSMSGERIGKIKYVMNGNTYSAPAKSEDEEVLVVGDEVVITEIQKSLFHVKKL